MLLLWKRLYKLEAGILYNKLTMIRIYCKNRRKFNMRKTFQQLVAIAINLGNKQDRKEQRQGSYEQTHIYRFIWRSKHRSKSIDAIL